MKILGTEINFDFCEVENMAKYENAFEEYMKELEEIKGFKGKDSEGFMKLCNIVYKFFDRLIGEGTANKIFGEKHNFANCMEAMGQVIKTKEDSVIIAQNIIDKYIPKDN